MRGVLIARRQSQRPGAMRAQVPLEEAMTVVQRPEMLAALAAVAEELKAAQRLPPQAQAQPLQEPQPEQLS